MKVFILTEGNRHLGFGHITRCTSLYEAFQEKKIIPTFIVNGDDTISSLLTDKKNMTFNWLVEREEIFDLIQNAEITIVDSYLADITFYNNISETVKIPVYIDDARRIDYPRGIVVNGTIYAEELNYPDKKDITYLLGSQYIPLRQGFWNVPEEKIREDIGTVMITFGGDDMRHLTPEVLKMLNENFPEYNKKVVLGKGFSNIDQIESLKDKKTQLIYYPDAEGMKKVMLESDVAISASGQTLYELARIGVPTIAISVADNQMNNVRGWKKAGFIEYAGWWEDKDVFNNIIKKIKLLGNIGVRKERVKKGKAFVDGLGAIRTVKHCLKSFFEMSIALRKAEMKDIYNVFELSNESDVRRSSFNPDKIELEDHKRWFFNKIKSKNCMFLVADIDKTFVGQVRFDINEDKATISVSIGKKYRGLGAGELIIRRALNILLAENPDISYVKAYIKKGNIRSAMLFEKTGFQFETEAIIKGQDALEYCYQFNRGE